MDVNISISILSTASIFHIAIYSSLNFIAVFPINLLSISSVLSFKYTLSLSYIAKLYLLNPFQSKSKFILSNFFLFYYKFLSYINLHINYIIIYTFQIHILKKQPIVDILP